MKENTIKSLILQSYTEQCKGYNNNNRKTENAAFAKVLQQKRLTFLGGMAAIRELAIKIGIDAEILNKIYFVEIEDKERV